MCTEACTGFQDGGTVLTTSLKEVWACAAPRRSKRDTEPAEELAAVSEWHHHISGDWSWWLLSYVSALKPILGEVDGIKFSAGCYLEIFCARHLTCRLLNITFSVPRRARTMSQKHKSISPSHHPTSSTIIFLTIKRTNAETNTIILPLQKKKSRKKHSHWKEFFLPSRQIFYDYIL